MGSKRGDLKSVSVSRLPHNLHKAISRLNLSLFTSQVISSHCSRYKPILFSRRRLWWQDGKNFDVLKTEANTKELKF